MGVKISELNEATSAQNSDVLPIVQNGETKKISVEALGIANAVKKSDLLNLIYPVGSIYMSVNSTSPVTLFGGTWEQIKGRFLLGTGGVEANTTDFWGELQENAFNCPPGERGGEATHRLTIDEMPPHSHNCKTYSGNNADGKQWSFKAIYNSSEGGIGTDNVGGGQPHNNMPPYLAVYMWKRIT